ncbi:MAG: hypothetical protein ACRDIY_08385 [Chloroflexota bacterium]
MKRSPGGASRIQFNLRPEQLRLVELLERKLAVRSRADLLQEAIGTLFWVVRESMRGRRVISVSDAELNKLDHVVEFASPALALATDDLYEYLVARPHPWRRQLSLKGRNMTVGQLVATMKADGLSAEAAAEDLGLPAAQIRDALAYYDLNRDLVDSELREDKSRLQSKGYPIGPPTVPR